MKLEKYRPTMTADVLHSWASDAQVELDNLRAELSAINGGPVVAEAEPVAADTAQDEREAIPTINDCMRRAGYEDYHGRIAFTVGQFERFVELISHRAIARARPAQTEQQPLTVPDGWSVDKTPDGGYCITNNESCERAFFSHRGHRIARLVSDFLEAILTTAPIAQTAPQEKGDE